MLREAQNFRKVKHKFRASSSSFAGLGAVFVAGAVLSQGQGQAQHFRKVRYRFWWQAQRFRKAGCRFRGRRDTFARSCTDFVAGAVFRDRRYDYARKGYVQKLTLFQLQLENRKR